MYGDVGILHPLDLFPPFVYFFFFFCLCCKFIYFISLFLYFLINYSFFFFFLISLEGETKVLSKSAKVLDSARM